MMPRIAILAVFSFALAACNTLAPDRYASSRTFIDDDIIPDLPEYASVYDDNVAYGVDSRIARPQTSQHQQTQSRTRSMSNSVRIAQPQIESIVTTKPNPLAAFFAPNKYETVSVEPISPLDEESSVTVIVPPPAPKVVAKPKKATTKKTGVSSAKKKTTGKSAVKKPSASKKPAPKPAAKKSTTSQKKPAPKR